MAAALRFLASRSRSEAEVRARLTSRGVSADDVDATLRRLRELGYVDDADFAQALIRARSGARARGRSLIAEELRAKGVDDELARATLDACYGDEIDTARTAALRQARRLHGRPFPEFRQKLGAFLVRRGFEHATAESLVTELWDAYGVPD